MEKFSHKPGIIPRGLMNRQGQKREARSEKREARSKKPEARSKKQGARSKEQEETSSVIYSDYWRLATDYWRLLFRFLWQKHPDPTILKTIAAPVSRCGVAIVDRRRLFLR
jgi:hypothetical protein